MSASADVVVIGGGLGGLSAALAAAEAGARVELLEAGAVLGGAARLSNGSLWTFPDPRTYLAHCPGADPALAERLTRGLPESVGWLRERGVVVEERGPSLYGAERSHRVVPSQLIDRLTEELAHRAGIQTGRRVTALSPGRESVRVEVDKTSLEAGAVVVSTGGVHADPAVLEAAGVGHYVGLPVRNHARSGDGVGLALACGAQLAATGDGIYGHLVPAGMDADLVLSPLAAQYQSVAGVMLGTDGSLIATPGTDDHDLSRLVSRLPGRRAILLFDDLAAPPRIRSDPADGGWAAERAAFATAHCPRATSAPSLDALLDTVAAWSVPIADEVRAAARRALRTPPFTAIEVEPSITYAGVGLRVDGGLRAEGLDRVFVAGADIGAAFGDGYAGGLSLALTTGIAAGAAAASAA